MFRQSLMALAIASLTAGSAWAAVSADEAKQLGTTLTAIGAEKAANKDGTIPEYTGGIKPPADFKAGSGFRTDPYASEKPRLVITGKDMAAQADKLTEGTKELLKRYPTMRVDVYPTHRTVALPQRVHDNTREERHRREERSTAGSRPRTCWPDSRSRSRRPATRRCGTTCCATTASATTASSTTTGTSTRPAWPRWPPPARRTGRGRSTIRRRRARSAPPIRTGWSSSTTSGRRAAPARGSCLVDSVNPLKQGRRAWQYLPGQRRVKLAPDLAYDTPNPGAAGAGTYDDVSVFNGAMDRYNWKLVGKKEMYIPYGNYRLTYHKNPADLTKPNHLNPDFVRWELHRVWVVEATLKEGARHIYAKRVFYLDEDSWLAVASDQYDAARPALPRELRVPVVQLRRPGAVRRHVRDLRFQLGAVQHHRPVRTVRRAQVHDRTAEGKLLVVRRAGWRRRPIRRILRFSTPDLIRAVQAPRG